MKYILCSFNIAYIPKSEDATVNNHSSYWSHGFDFEEQMCWQRYMEFQASISCACYKSKMGHRLQGWTNIIPVMPLECFGKPCIYNYSRLLLILILILLLTFFAACSRASQYLSFPLENGFFIYFLGS